MSKAGKKFVAQIQIDGEKKNLGYFTKARDAAMAYDKAIVANQLPYKKLNFPDDRQSEEEEPECYICMEQCENKSPCNCERFVHEKCLVNWCQRSENDRCMVCLEKYPIKKKQ